MRQPQSIHCLKDLIEVSICYEAWLVICIRVLTEFLLMFFNDLSDICLVLLNIMTIHKKWFSNKFRGVHNWHRSSFPIRVIRVRLTLRDFNGDLSGHIGLWPEMYIWPCQEASMPRKVIWNCSHVPLALWYVHEHRVIHWKLGYKNCQSWHHWFHGYEQYVCFCTPNSCQIYGVPWDNSM